MSKNWQKHNETRDRLMKLVPKTLPKEIDSWLDSHCLKEHHYIFYNRREDYAYCTNCHKAIDRRIIVAQYAKHGEPAHCPICNVLAEYKCIGKYRKQEMARDYFQVQIIQRTTEGILFRRFELLRACRKDSAEHVHLQWYWNELQRIFNDGMTVKRYRSDIDHYGGTGVHWNESKKMDFDTKNTMGWVTTVPSFDYKLNLSAELKGTPWQYARAGMSLEYYAAWIKPVEYLEKSKWSALEQDILNFDTRWLNLRAESLDKFLRLPKKLIKYAREADLDTQGLRILRKLIKEGTYLPNPETLYQFTRNYQYRYEEAVKIAPAIKLKDWFKFQHKITGYQTGQHYIDYLRFCNRLDYDLTDPQILYPSDIEAAHDREMVKIEIKSNEGLETAIKKRYKKDSLKFSYSSEEFIIRPPANMEELIREGTSLNHCVGTYAQRVADNETTILFIRRKDSPEDSFYTLEYKSKRIIQCRGKRNCDMTNEVNTFVKKWSTHLEAKKKKPVAVPAAM